MNDIVQMWIKLQKWNNEESRCKCKDLEHWSSCEKDYMWNPSICECEWNKAWKMDEYLGVKICSCEKRLMG